MKEVDVIDIEKLALIDPDNQDESFLAAIQNKEDVLTHAQNFQNALKQAIEVEVPDNLQQRILANHQIEIQQEQQQVNKPTSYLKAKLIALFGVMASLMLWLVLLLRPGLVISEQMLEHIYDLDHVISHVRPVTPEEIYDAEKRFGLMIDQDKLPGKLKVFAECELGEITSLHAVYQGDKGLVTFYYAPVDVFYAHAIHDNRHHSRMLKVPGGVIGVFGVHGEPLDKHLAAIDNAVSRIF